MRDSTKGLRHLRWRMRRACLSGCWSGRLNHSQTLQTTVERFELRTFRSLFELNIFFEAQGFRVGTS